MQIKMKFIFLVLILTTWNYSHGQTPCPDCNSAVYLCDKSLVNGNSINGYGSSQEGNINGTCFDFAGETNSSWYKWTCATSGTLTMVITSSSQVDDMDWIIFELQNGINSCANKNPLSCNVSTCPDDNGNNTTGLNATDLDASEPAGCLGIFGQSNSYCRQFNLTAGVSYAIMINNCLATSSFTLEWGGTCTFTGASNPITSDVSICYGTSATVMASGISGSTIKWYNSSAGGSPIATGTTYTTPILTSETSYWVSQTNNGCESPRVEVHVSFLGLPIITTLSSTISSCLIDNGTATAITLGGISPYSYSWNSSPVQTTSSATNLPTGIIILTVTDAVGCHHKDSIMVGTQNSLVISMVSTSINCLTHLGTASALVAGGFPSYSYLWSNGSSASSISSPASGFYSVIVTDQVGCTIYDSVEIMPITYPISIAGSNSAICEGVTLELTATNSTIAGSTYQWTGPNGFSSSLQNPNISPSTLLATGEYILFVTANGCTSPDTTVVLIKPVPIADFSYDITEGCVPLKVHFEDQSTPLNNTALWNFGDGSFSTSTNNTSHMYIKDGTFDVSLISSTNGCSDTILKTQIIDVFANAVPFFIASPDTATIFDPTISFINLSSNSNSYVWDFGDMSQSTVKNPFHTYLDVPASYEVQLFATNEHECADSIILKIVIIEPLLFYVPNSFTPDGDKYNGIFLPVLTSGMDKTTYQMQIFNRWGETVFQTKDINIGWDGTYKSELAKEGTYTWSLQFKDKFTAKRYIYNGNVNILR